MSRLTDATGDDDNDTILAAVKETLDQDPEIDGVLATSTPGCMAAAVAIEATGKVIGEQVDLIGKETSPLLKLFRPKIITYFEDIGVAGAFLARAATAAVDDPDARPKQFLEVPVPDGFSMGDDTKTKK